MKKSLLLCGVTTLTASVWVAPSWGQDVEEDQSVVDDTIVVTARKKEQSIQDVPLAITAIDSVEIEDAAYDNIIDLSRAAPGLFVESINDRNARVATSPRFRGVTFDATSPLQRTATVFVDGIIVTGGIQSLGVQELERVEIIKGPQSALFGRNTFSGAINYVTRDPSDEFQVDADWSFASRDELRLLASVEGPIIGDVLTGRVNASYVMDGGHYVNSNGGQELGEETTLSFSGAILFQPTDNFRLKLRGQYYRNSDGPAATASVGGFTEHNFAGFPIDPVTGEADTSAPFSVPTFDDLNADLFTESVFRGTLPIPGPEGIGLNTTQAEFAESVAVAFATGDPTFLGFDFDDLGGAGLIGDGVRFTADAGYEFENGITFNVLAGYNRDEFLFYADFDSTATFGFNTTGAQDAEDLSIEARVAGTLFNDRLDWTIGGSYVDVDLLTAGGFWDGALGFWFPGLFEAPNVTAAETIGVFGILDYELTDQLTLIFEARYQSDEITDESVLGSPATFNSFLPRVLLQYEPTDDTLLYANYSVGNLPGGFNPEVGELDAGQLAELLAQNPGVSETFGEERLINYELGWKQSLLDNRLSFNLAGFFMRRTDQIFSGFQVVSAEADEGNTVRTVAFTDNGATTNIFGVELDAFWSITDDLSVQGSFAYIDATVDSFPEGAGAGDFTDVFGPNADPSGQQAARFPPLAGSFSATYERPISGDFFGGGDTSWYARGDLFYTGKFFDEITNVAEVPDAVDINLRTGIRTERVRYEFFVTNLLNEDAPQGANNIADTSAAVRFGSNFFDFFRESTQIALRDRRQFGGRVTVSF